MYTVDNYDVIVIGGGHAGLCCALGAQIPARASAQDDNIKCIHMYPPLFSEWQS